MPRPSAASLSDITAPIPVARLQAPDHLDADERAQFREIVLACRPDHFLTSDAPLIWLLAKSLVLARKASAELQRAGYVDLEHGRPHPWHGIMVEAMRRATAISRTLRLTPQSRLPLVSKEQ